MPNHVDIPIDLDDLPTTTLPDDPVLVAWAQTERSNDGEKEPRQGRVKAFAMVVVAFIVSASAFAIDLLLTP